MDEIICKDVAFYYGKKQVLNNINIRIYNPGIYALVGDNGTGKTTFLKLLCRIYKAKGIITPLKDKLSFMIAQNALYDYLTVKQNLMCMALIYNEPLGNVKKVINICGLSECINVKTRHLSYGNKQKVLIAMTILKDAAIYLFDEPFNGLDPKAMMCLKKVLLSLKEDGKIVIVSSHLLKELDDISDYILFIKNNTLKFYNKKKMPKMEVLFND